MVQVIDDPYSGNVFGRIGKGVGKGLSEQLPKEMERSRLSSGLKKLEQEKDLDPMQFFTRALTLPGMTPQAIESLGKLAKHRMQAQGLKGFAGEREKGADAFPKSIMPEVKGQKGEAPSITTRTPIEATLNPYIPMSTGEINQAASQVYEENPAFFQHEPQRAIDYVRQQDAQEQAINSALQGQRSNEQQVQSTIVNSLKDQNKLLGTRVPSNVYSSIEDKAINAVRSKKDGGEGLTEQEAMKKYGKELDSISRDYSSIDALGNWGILQKPSSSTLNGIRSLQTKFAERNDLENFAQELMTKNKLSPGIAHYLAYPPNQTKELNNTLMKAPNIPRPKPGIEPPIPEHVKIRKTEELAKKLAPTLGKNGSPLSVAEELKAKGYDPQTWLNYLRKNRKSLDLTESQARQLDIALPKGINLNDLWLIKFAGLDKLEEIK